MSKSGRFDWKVFVYVIVALIILAWAVISGFFEKPFDALINLGG